MKKTTWLLLVLSLVAVFLVAGCQPATTPGGEEPGGEEPPITPPADTAPPKVVKTVISNAEGWDDGEFKLTIVFDEDIYSPCAENLNNWTIRVKNSQRGNTDIRIRPENIDILQIVGNQIIIYAWVAEPGTPVTTIVPFVDGYASVDEARDAANALIDMVEGLSGTELMLFLFRVGDGSIADGQGAWNDFEDAIAAAITVDDYNDAFTAFGYTVEEGDPPVFAGLICSEEDADRYEEELGVKVTAADVVTWELSDDCAISDILGNSHCGYSGQACCVGPSCEECVECDLTTGVCK